MKALVTGGSRSIGAGIARKLAADGHEVVIGFSGSERGRSAAEKLIAEIEAAGGKAWAVGSDISTLEGVQALYDGAVEHLGHIDILVNNAGIDGNKLFLDNDEEEWDRLIDTDLRPVYRMSRLVVPGMLERRFGRIISVASICGMTGYNWPRKTAYGAVKAGVIGFTKCLAVEMAPYGITVNAVSPGPIATDMNAGYITNEEGFRKFLEGIPVRHMGSPKDIANAVAYLASPEQDYITGQVISPNGGMLMA